MLKLSVGTDTDLPKSSKYLADRENFDISSLCHREMKWFLRRRSDLFSIKDCFGHRARAPRPGLPDICFFLTRAGNDTGCVSSIFLSVNKCEEE